MTSELLTKISMWALPIKPLLKLMTASHILLYRLSQGAIGGLVAGMPNLLLTTVGRKSGKRYTTPLFFLPWGKSFAVVASYAGNPVEPQWWKNLKHANRGWIEIGPKRFEVRPEEARREVKEQLWEAFTQLYPGYDTYQQRTERVIDVVLLHPIDQPQRPRGEF
jgi:deazaflavin-dependent oxidoreductase (nitroreductase family)